MVGGPCVEPTFGQPTTHAPAGISEMMPAAASGCLAAAKRGRLSERQWADIGKAARIARAHGVQLTVHGITITAACSKEQPRFAADAAWPLQQQPAEPAAPQPEPQKDEGNPPPPPSKKQRRSQQRLAEFQAKKRATLIASSPRVRCFLRQFRWQRMQRVWTEWSAQQLQHSPVRDVRQVCGEVKVAARRSSWQPWVSTGGKCVSDVAASKSVGMCTHQAISRDIAILVDLREMRRAGTCAPRAYSSILLHASSL